MLFNPKVLFTAPVVNPVNKKARSIPLFNPINVYGRVFFFAWFGFMIAFLSWYAFPPLLSVTIKNDLNLTTTEVANSNIISVVATLLVRLVAGTLCDRFGPRYVFAGCLLAGAIPTALAGTVTSATGLIALRFFIGILGGSFVPCQVWSTGFFDKNVVGTANSLTAGFGNAGGGITYFVMPAIFDSLVARGETPHKAWRVSFVVPFIIIVVTAISLLILCPDTPTGKWSDRHLAAQQNLENHGISATVVDVPGSVTDEKRATGTESPSSEDDMMKKDHKQVTNMPMGDHEAQISRPDMIAVAQGEVVKKPTIREIGKVFLSPQTLALALFYMCSFGAELSINNVLGAYYLKNFPKLGQTGTGNWAAMFGLLNVIFRPLGGIAADLLYKYTGSVWSKKILLHTLALCCGAFLLAIGLLDSKDNNTMFGLVAGMAFFLEAGNGANFALVPHVHPFANGVVSGIVGAAGNLGGILFSVAFRFQGVNYGRVFWIIGLVTMVVNGAVVFIRPIPRGQIGGH